MEEFKLFVFFILYLFFSIILFLVSKRVKVDWRLVLAFFTIHTLVLLVANVYELLPDFQDSDTFHNLSINIIDNTFYSGSNNVSTSFGAELYSKLVIVPMYLLFTVFPLNVILFNNFILSISFIIISKLAIELSNKNTKIQKYVFILATFYPSLIMYSSIMIRDTLVIFGISLFIYEIYKFLIIGTKGTNFLNLAISIFLVVGLRPQNAPVIIFSLLVLFLMNSKIILQKKLLFILLFFIIFFVLIESPLFRFIRLINVDYINSYRYSQVIQFDAYLIDIKFQSWADIIINIPRLLFYYLFVPFPWYARNYSYLFATIDSIYCVILILTSIASLRKIRKINLSKNKKTFIFVCLGIVLVSAVSYSLVEAYFGGAVRHRIQQMYLLIPFSSIFYYSIFEKSN